MLRLGIEGSGFLGRAAFVVLDDVGVKPQLLVPLGLESVDNERLSGSTFM
ncbi:hypothetical protein NKH36_13935 [Mesorhizobium sp. M1312]